MKPSIIKRPVITEKSLEMANSQNKYTFEVDRNANKNQIAEVVSATFGVEVIDVNTTQKYRVRKTTGRKRLPVLAGLTKKAIVSVKPGQTIDVFDLGGSDA